MQRGVQGADRKAMQFQKVFAINMESRTDKKDTRTLAAALTGFDIEWLPGVAYEDVSQKAAPPVSFASTSFSRCPMFVC